MPPLSIRKGVLMKRGRLGKWTSRAVMVGSSALLLFRDISASRTAGAASVRCDSPRRLRELRERDATGAWRACGGARAEEAGLGMALRLQQSALTREPQSDNPLTFGLSNEAHTQTFQFRCESKVRPHHGSSSHALRTGCVQDECAQWRNTLQKIIAGYAMQYDRQAFGVAREWAPLNNCGAWYAGGRHELACRRGSPQCSVRARWPALVDSAFHRIRCARRRRVTSHCPRQPRANVADRGSQSAPGRSAVSDAWNCSCAAAR
jgi:hypothetical protein